jgi:hypothetical protein
MDNTQHIEKIAKIMIRNHDLFPIVGDLETARGVSMIEYALIRTTGLEFVVNTYFKSLDLIWCCLDTKVMAQVLNSTYSSILLEFMILPNSKELQAFYKKEKLN